MSEYILKSHDLTKQFGQMKAVNAVSMHVKKGEIYGFVGRNGAGKTTFLKMIANLSDKSSGEIELFGSKYLSKARGKIGILIENPGLYPNFSAYDNLKMKAIMLGVPHPDQKIHELLRFVGLEKVARKKSKNFSLGMKQRLGLAMTLLNDPELILLDEPINGLDPQGIVEVREVLLKLQKEKNMTIIISSHILEELGKIANRYGVISSGQLVKELTSEQLEELSKNSIQLDVDDIEKTIAVLDHQRITQFQVNGNSVEIFDVGINSGELNKSLIESGVIVSSIFKHKESVEDMFIEMMGGANYV